MEDNGFAKWYNESSKKERELYRLMCQFELEYFEDLTLKIFEKSKDFETTHDDGTVEYVDMPPISLDAEYKIRVEMASNKETANAQCDTKNRVITLFNGRYEKSKNITLLHEMIHAYEYKLRELMTWRDFVLIYLYKKMSKKIGMTKLRSILSTESHPWFFINTAHNLLFVLKCIELDIRLKKKLGSVLAYGRDEWYK